MARAAIVACIALVLAVAGWTFLANTDGPPLAPQPTADAARATPAVLATTTAGEAADATAKPDAADVERTNASLDAASEAPALPADAKWVDVLIADKATKEPIAGADVSWTDDTQQKLLEKMPRRERDALQRDQDAFAARFGWRTRSDQAGKVRITAGKNHTHVRAREGKRFGETWLQLAGLTPPDGFRVLLADDVTLRVRVLDHAGHPAAHVPISLVDVQPDGKLGDDHFGALPTGTDGVATFAHLQQRHRGRGKPVEKWAVRVAINRLDVAPVHVDAVSPPAEPVEITLPPTGRLALRMLFEGKPVPGMEWIGVRAGRPGDDEPWRDVWSRSVDADHFARFPYVPLGQTFVVNSWSANGGGVWDLEVDGPQAVDQEVSRTLELAGDVVALTGRLLDGDGAPLVEQTVSTRVGGNEFSPGGSNVETDAGGRFLWIYTRRSRTETEPVKLEQLTFERQVENGSPQRVVVAPRTLATGRNDLGDLRFAVASLVVSGRFVFDSPGSQKASFSIQRYTEPTVRNEPANVTMPSRPGRPAPGPQWRHVGDLQLATQDDGSFEARGAVEAGRYRIHVGAAEHLPVEPVEFVPGARDVQIAIRRGAGLTVRCRLPEGVEAQRVNLDLERPGAPKPAAAPPRRMYPGGGGGGSLRGQPSWGASDSGYATYRWPALEPATYTLRVTVFGFADTLLTIGDVVVPPPAGGDPRLQDLDLCGVIGTLRLRVRSGEDSEYVRVMVIPQPPPAEGQWPAMSVQQEETVLPVPKRPLDLLVARQQYQPVTLRAVSGAADVTLQPWPKVELRFTGIDALPEGASLRAGTRDASAPPGPPATRTQVVSDSFSGSVDSLLQPSSGGTMKDGVMTLRCGDRPRKLSLTLSFDGRNKPLKQFSPDEITAGGPITVQLSADEVRTVLEELKQPPAEKK